MSGPDLREELLRSLSQDSTLLVFLRAFYSLMLDYGVYLPDKGDPIAFSKEQLVTLVERGRSEDLLADLPALEEEGLFRPLDPEGLDGKTGALVVEGDGEGAYVSTLFRALHPDEVEYPEWWEAPVPFAIATRAGLKLNSTAILLFGAELERLSTAALPRKDEFIVELEGREKPCFLAFRRLEPNIFTIDDCTNDLVEAQDISWWAAVGRAWTLELEGQGLSWRRSESPSQDGQSWPCEWQGRFMGYLCAEALEGPAGKGKKSSKTSKAKKAVKPKKRTSRKPSAKTAQAPEASEKEDEVLKALGPQTMGLLAAGIAREAPLVQEAGLQDEKL